MVASELTRSVLYAAFVVGGAVALFLSKEPRSRDGRGVVIAASLIASILMIGVNFLPAGPVLWSASLHVFQVGLVLTVFGAALALTAITNLRSNFSIAPEARMLVVTGPYRILRHPIYSAELLMIVGVAIGQLRLTTLFGVLGLIGLQTFRVQREEALLRRAFPRAFEEFSARTRFRLLPLLW
jgi:protein-S-isoprenylcysteine O-methyltransferase Ste14